MFSPVFTKKIWFHFAMYSPHLLDQILDFYGSYMIENYPLLILLVFLVLFIISFVEVFGCIDLCLVTHVEDGS